MMPYYFDDPDEAIEFVEGLIDSLPDVSFCSRLCSGHRNEVSSEVRRSVEIAYAGNGHQHDPALSSRSSTKCSRRGIARAFRLLIVRRGANVHLLFRVWQRTRLSGRVTNFTPWPILQ